MGANLNKVMLIGNLTRDPEKRYTPSGMAVADISVAVNRRYKAGNGEMKDEVCFVPVTLWSRDAENAAKFLSKGSPIFIEGRLKLDQWEKDGKKNSKLTVVAERMQFIGGGTRREGGGSPDYGDVPHGAPDEGWSGGGEPSEEPPARPASGGSSGEKPDDLPF